MRLGLVCAVLLGCASVGDDGGELGASEGAIAAGSAEEAGVLAFVNAPATDFALLDGAVGLDARAAAGIVARRPFGSIAQLETVPYVKATAVAKVLVYVRSIGGIPEDVEGVLLTAGERAAIVAAANGATIAELDAHLDTRAATGLVARRPLVDIHAVAASPYVGKVALAALRTWAPTWNPAPPATCAIALAPRADTNADAWNARLDLGGDLPFGELVALQAPACANLDDAMVRTAIAAAIHDTGAIHWQIDPSLAPAAGTFALGSGGYLNRLATEQDAITTRSSGWTATDAATLAALEQSALLDQHAETAASRRTYAIDLATDAEECSEHATILLDRVTGAISIAHDFPGC